MGSGQFRPNLNHPPEHRNSRWYDLHMTSMPQKNVTELERPVCVSARQAVSEPKRKNKKIAVTYGDPWETEPCDLLPPNEFHAADESPTDRLMLRSRFGVPDENTGPNSSAVRSRFISCTAGWPTPPTSSEFFLALQAEDPSSRQKAVVRAWLAEATYQEIILAWLEEAYSWQDLVAAVHRVGYRHNGLNRYLNQFAKREAKQALECLPQPSF